MNQYPEKIIPKEYKIINTIGSGSFGKIYKVKWNKNNNNYAMKVMHFENKDKKKLVKQSKPNISTITATVFFHLSFSNYYNALKIDFMI